MYLTREQAAAKYGEEAVRIAEAAPCEPTNRVMENGKMEWASQTEPVQAYYYTPDDIEDTDSIEWEIDHYEDVD